MAKVVPYACATAHGKVNDSIAFKRSRDKVLLVKTPRPGYTNTAAQQPVRQDFKDAVLRYQLANYSEKYFLRKRSTQFPGNAYNLWISQYLKNRIWSREKPVGLKTVENMVIQDPVGSELDNAIISIEAIVTDLDDLDCYLWNKLGSIYQVEHSERGRNGVITGTLQFLAGKFGLGVYNTTDSNYITFVDVHTFYRGIIDHWWVPDFDSNDISFNMADIAQINYIPGVEFLVMGYIGKWTTWEKVFWMYGYDGTLRCRYFFTPLPFDADDKIHLEWIINHGKPAGERYRLFQNGTELTPSLIDYDNELDFAGTDIALISLWAPAESKAVVDNWKVYPVDVYAAQISANREFENFSPVPLIIGTYGQVNDNSNIFTPGADIEDTPAQRIVIQNIGGYDLEIPFRYYVAVTWSGPGVESRTSLIRFPKMSIGIGKTAYLYLASDWSTYFDKNLIDLACTDKM